MTAKGDVIRSWPACLAWVKLWSWISIKKVVFLSQRRGQALLNMLWHPEFRVNDVQSATIVQPLRRLERPFKESVVVEYNLWKPGNENQMLELAIRYYLELFRQITHDQRWKDDFRVDLVARAIFDNIGNRLIGPPCSILNWERIQQQMELEAAHCCCRNDTTIFRRHVYGC